MANTKVSALTAVTSAAATDIAPVVVDPGGSPASRKITLLNLIKSLLSFVGITADGTTVDVGDATLRVVGSADATKRLRFEVDAVSAGATRVLTAPDHDGTIATLAGTETFANKTLTTPAIGSFANAQHTHQDAAGGGTLDAAAIGSGSLSPARMPAYSGTLAFWTLPVQSYNITPANAAVGTNGVRVLRFYLPQKLSVTSIVFEVTTNAGGASVGFGIYSGDGSTLLAETGAISAATTGVKTGTLAVSLNPGFYYLAYTSTDVTVAFRGIGTNTNLGGILNTGTTHMGDSSNTSSAAVLPASLGTITALAVALPFVKLQQ